jgi:hypothetical protein
MVSVSMLGISHDSNSSYMRGASEAPAYIRPELNSDASGTWFPFGGWPLNHRMRIRDLRRAAVRVARAPPTVLRTKCLYRIF